MLQKSYGKDFHEDLKRNSFYKIHERTPIFRWVDLKNEIILWRLKKDAESIHVSRYPVVGFFERDLEVEKEVDLMMAVVKQIRSLRGEYKLTNKQKTKEES